MLEIGTKVLSNWGSDDSNGHTGVVIGYHPDHSDNDCLAVQFSAKWCGQHDCCGQLRTRSGWFIHERELKVVELPPMLKDPVFTLEELTG